MVPITIIWTFLVFGTGWHANDIHEGKVSYTEEVRIYGVDEIKY